MSKCEFKTTIQKKIRISTDSNEKGLILIAALALISILALVATLSVTTTYTDIKISSNYKTSIQARYIAEAGVHRAIGMLNTTPGWIEGIDPDNAFPVNNSLGNGTYVVKVFEDDPTPGSVRINSTGNAAGSSSIVEVIVTRQYYGILDYSTFGCGFLDLKVSETNVISGDVFVNGNLDMAASGIQQIQDGDVYATGDININGSSSITGGSAFANGDIYVQSSASPYNIDGNATAAGTVSGSGTVSGTITQGVSPDPVTNRCSGNNLADIIITSEDIQNLRDNAVETMANYTFDAIDNYTGIVYITNNFQLVEDATFSGNVIFIVDSNATISGSLTSSPPGSTVTFLVPNGNLTVQGGGSYTIDGTVIVGTVNQDGSGVTGGNINVRNGSDLTVNGNLIAVYGDTDASSGGAFIISYQSPGDSNLMKPRTYTMTRWRQVRN